MYYLEVSGTVSARSNKTICSVAFLSFNGGTSYLPTRNVKNLFLRHLALPYYFLLIWYFKVNLHSITESCVSDR